MNHESCTVGAGATGPFQTAAPRRGACRHRTAAVCRGRPPLCSLKARVAPGRTLLLGKAFLCAARGQTGALFPGIPPDAEQAHVRELRR
eukprot:CAMPEP_0179316704 /NCGR_PEP_ID=MMETSP0797-20121207/55832_1 /TAXON_ID=47934 /ORGANISM="Dinophysis acuminata, Strain DAEP01" /LENGTH=88 /DNA_ID=CAMNT_0021027503 /DNA_START=68 /DNA_END=331 /DNA_ORIENTATION=-